MKNIILFILFLLTCNFAYSKQGIVYNKSNLDLKSISSNYNHLKSMLHYDLGLYDNYSCYCITNSKHNIEFKMMSKEIQSNEGELFVLERKYRKARDAASAYYAMSFIGGLAVAHAIHESRKLEERGEPSGSYNSLLVFGIGMNVSGYVLGKIQGKKANKLKEKVDTLRYSLDIKGVRAGDNLANVIVIKMRYKF